MTEAIAVDDDDSAPGDAQHFLHDYRRVKNWVEVVELLTASKLSSPKGRASPEAWIRWTELVEQPRLVVSVR